MGLPSNHAKRTAHWAFSEASGVTDRFEPTSFGLTASDQLDSTGGSNSPDSGVIESVGG